MKKILDDSFQFFQTNRSIVVDVKYSKIKININNPSQKIMYEQTDWLSEKNMINHIKNNKTSIKQVCLTLEAWTKTNGSNKLYTGYYSIYWNHNPKL